MSGPTYTAVAVTAPNTFEVVTRTMGALAAGHVRLRVEACGVCHSDVVTVTAINPTMTFPRVPGHEVVGRIESVGPGVQGWAVGQRVGVGFIGAHCGVCARCLRGDFVTCTNQKVTGVDFDGGYAEMMDAPAIGLVRIPDDLASIDAAPLLCAGITTFNALRHSPARPGDLVAVHGIGGLGHLAVQYANKMGFRTVAIARGADKAALASRLGAHHYIDSALEDVGETLQALGGASVILATVSSGKAMTPLLAGLRPRGRLIVVGVGLDPIEVSTFELVFGARSIEGALTGTPVEGEDALAFSTAMGVAPMVETMPLKEAEHAYQRMMRGDARFRIVLTMDAPTEHT